MYEKYMVVLEKLEGDTPITSLRLEETPLWIQIHNLPIRRLSAETGSLVGATIGRVLKVTDPEEAYGGVNWLRVKVMVDVEQPLCQGRKINFDGINEVWVSFLYERLPNFCYWCSRLSHTESDCPTWLGNNSSMNKEEQQYGPWLRATQIRSSRPIAVTVQGDIPPTMPDEAHTPQDERWEEGPP
jgi:hypothetical protein